MSSSTGTWNYDPGPRQKHKWEKDIAGFDEQSDGRKIGKCPSSMSSDDAEQLLNEGVDGTSGVSDRADADYPENIYSVDEQGVVYRAVPTRPGHSYHGFPAGDQRRISRRVKDELLERAAEKDCETEAKRWMRDHMNVPSL